MMAQTSVSVMLGITFLNLRLAKSTQEYAGGSSYGGGASWLTFAQLVLVV